MKMFKRRPSRETSIEADIAVLFLNVEGFVDDVRELESRFDKLSNDIRELKLKVKS